MQPSTTIQWSLRLSDAALISTTLREAAKSASDAAEYLSSERYADTQRERDEAWVLSLNDLDRIAAYRDKAARLTVLAES